VTRSPSGSSAIRERLGRILGGRNGRNQEEGGGERKSSADGFAIAKLKRRRSAKSLIT
jgi:hypothetical protein